MFFIHWKLQGTKIFYREQISHENIQRCQTKVLLMTFSTIVIVFTIVIYFCTIVIMFNFNYRPALLWKYFSIVSVAKLIYVFIAPGIEEPDIGLNEVFTPELRCSSDITVLYLFVILVPCEGGVHCHIWSNVIHYIMIGRR